MSDYPFKATIWLYQGKAAWGSVRVIAATSRTTWKTSIFPDSKAGAYLPPIKADVRKKEKIATGDTDFPLRTIPHAHDIYDRMGTKSNIEWTEFTWNPATGCTKISPGCKHCYAEVMADRLQAMGAPGYENGFKLTLHPDRLAQPIKRKKPTTYFVNSMSDLFHEDIPFEYLDQVFDVIRQTPQHTYQILTKRADQMEAYFQNREVPMNAWLGVSVEDKKYGLPRIDYLRRVKASTRFLSVEPLLEDLGTFDLTDIHWVIVGGESGNKARPMHPEWVENIANQCAASGTAFFFKQWGTWGADGVKRTKHGNGREFQGRTWDGTPISPQMSFALTS